MVALIYVIDIFSKYAWVFKGITITNALQKLLEKSLSNQTKYE